MRDILGPAVAVAVVVGAISLLAYGIYWRYQHPCIKYELRWVELYVETQVHYIDCGKNCSVPTTTVIVHPAHWDQVCIIYGNRKEGDVEAGPAPIPAERSW